MHQILLIVFYIPVILPAALITFAAAWIMDLGLSLESSMTLMMVEIIAYTVVIASWFWFVIYWFLLRG